MPDIYTYWCYGNLHGCRQFVSMLKDKIASTSPDKKSFNYAKFDCDASDPNSATAAQIVKVLRNRDAFDTRPRLIEMRGVPEDYALLTDFLSLTNQKNVLLINGQPGYRGSYGRWNPIQVSKLFKAVKEKGVVRDFGTDAKNAGEAVTWCEDIFKHLEKTPEKGCSDALVSHKGLNYDILFCEIEKLCTYQSGKKITVQDVIDCCSYDHSDTIWSFIDFLDMNDCDKAASHLEAFYLEHHGSLYGEVSALFAALMQHLTFLLFIKDGRDAGMADADVVKGWKKLSLSQIKELGEGKADKDTLEDYFKPNFISFNLYKNGVKNALKWKKSKIYSIMNCLQRSMVYCRINSGNVTCVKTCLSSFVLVATERMSSDNFFGMFTIPTDRMLRKVF